MLSQERKLREIGEGSKRIGEDLQVQAKRVDGVNPTSLQGAPVWVAREAWPAAQRTFSIAGSDWLGIPAGGSSTPAAQLTSSTGSQGKKELIEETPGELQEKSQISGISV